MSMQEINDIDKIKSYDMLEAQKSLYCPDTMEKIRFVWVSNLLSTLQNDFKVKIDDSRRIDLDVKRYNGIT